jgi:hypothetical protein
MSALDVLSEFRFVCELPPAIFDWTDESFLRHAVEQQIYQRS